MQSMEPARRSGGGHQNSDSVKALASD